MRVPAVNGLPDDVYHLLHRSFASLVRMRRSIESGDVALRSSAKVIAESEALLKRIVVPSSEDACRAPSPPTLDRTFL
jgi:hypothetical protein